MREMPNSSGINGIFITALFLLGFFSTAQAMEDGPYPQLNGEISMEVENDYTYGSDDKSSELNDLYLTIEPAVSLHVTPTLSFHAGLVLEPVLDPGSGQSRAFKHHGLYLDSLTIQYERDKFLLFGGKFTPNFGVAWDRAAGIYGTIFAEDYEFAGQVGFGGGWSFGNDVAGEHTVSASTFFKDTSACSDSLLTRRGRTAWADGGVGNTEELSSFALGLDGGGMEFLPALAYHLSFISQARGVTEEDDQQGVAFALEYPIKASADVVVTPLIEYVHFDNADGIDGDKRDYLTASIKTKYKNWNQALVYGIRNTDQSSGDGNDSFLQFSLGYGFDCGLSVDVGWMTIENGPVRSNLAGLLVSYSLEF